MEWLFVFLCFAHCLLKLDATSTVATYSQKILLYSPIFSVLIILYFKRGIRLHLVPASCGFVLYMFASTFLIFEETIYYYYVTMTFISATLLLFFGKNYYSSFQIDGEVGCN